MKKILIVIVCFFLGNHLFAQLFMEKGNLKVGISVTQGDRMLPIDQLCKGFHPYTNVPIDLMVPEGSMVNLIKDSIKAVNTRLMLYNQEPDYIHQPEAEYNNFSTNMGPGAINSYSFIDDDLKDTLTIEWKVDYGQPRLLDLYPANYFAEYNTYTFQDNYESYPDSVKFDWSSVEYLEEQDERGFPISPAFPYNHAGLLFVVYLTENAMIQMKGYHDDFQKIKISNPFDLLLYEDLQPGAYEFIAQPYEDAPEQLWLKYPFTIKPPWWKTGQFKSLVGLTLIIILAIIIILSLITRQRRREKELRWQQQITDAELKAIRAQLNPHFLFNALSSIQNLVNQRDNERANLYITKLSRLLRRVLSSSESPFQELEDELQLTRLYLELEQLRFPFTLKIDIDKSVDSTTLVPVMLLQPYVENAVKHGVAGNPEGEITIKISSNSSQLSINILDNGPGLSGPNNGQSKGLELGNNQIHHLDNLYMEQASVSIKNRTDQKGVIVKIKLPIE